MRCCWSKNPEGWAENSCRTVQRVQGCSRRMHQTPVVKDAVAASSSHQVYQWFVDKIVGHDSREYLIDQVPCCLGILDRDEVDCSCYELVR
jgi:hypothetical protein